MNPRRPLSAVVISFNERDRIAECLASLAFADEIVVVDAGSTDGTADIARKYTTRVVHVPWKGFGPQKQAAVELARHDVILNVDCDERVTPELAREIAEVLSGDGMLAGYSVPRKTFLGSKEIRHSGWYPDRTVRLFDRKRARFSDSIVHERVIVDGETGALRRHLVHYSFPGVADLFRKMDRYTDLSARKMFEEGRRCHVTDLTVRPFLAFAKSYLARAGFLDGVEGFVIGVAAAVHVFAKYAKLRDLARASRGGAA
ncbi:MAG: glycosyltransferase family 2 protein [Deltaproteobacteria bacterium]|nr:glycosyltransferase family 2 protein [Deltaproteobacteria bacterium]